MFVIICEPHEDNANFGYGPFASRQAAAEWLEASALYSIRTGTEPCPSEHPIMEIFAPHEVE
jgi:hypothetical protein